MARNAAVLALAFALATATATAQTEGELSERVRQAESLERAGQTARALMALEAVLETAPAEPAALLAYERILRRLGRLEEVLPAVERAVTAEPGSGLIRQLQLRVLAELGETDELRRAGEAWLAAVPGSDVPYREIAAAYRQVGQRDAAESVLRGGQASLGPPALAAELADFYSEEGRWSDAAEQWLELQRASPRLAWELVTYKLRRLGRDAEPAAAALLARTSNEPSLASRRLAVIAALYAGRGEEAQTRAADLLEELEPVQRSALLSQLAAAALGLAEPALVSWAYRELLREAPSDSARWALARRAVGYDLGLGDTATALATLRDLGERAASGSAAARWASAVEIRLLAALGDAERAQRALERHVAAYGNGADVTDLALAVADANLKLGRLEEADRVLDLVPNPPTSAALAARATLARAYLDLYSGRYGEARAGLAAAAAGLRGAERAEAVRLLAFLREANEAELAVVAQAQRTLRQGRARQAFERLRDGLEPVMPSGARPALLLWAGELGLAAGESARAEVTLRRVVDEHPGSGAAPVALLTLAESLADAGRREEAIVLLETLILEYPASALTPLGRRRLAELERQVPRS